MRTVVLGERPPELEAFLQRRARLGLDGYDEVWNGEYHVAPMSYPHHGELQAQVLVALQRHAARLIVSGPINVGPHKDNFRVPDAVVLRQRATALYVPTVAIAVEIVSPGDESYEKFDFYFDQGVDEVLIVEPRTREVLLYSRGERGFEPAEHSAVLGVARTALAGSIDWPDISGA